MKIELYRIFEIIKNANAINKYSTYKIPLNREIDKIIDKITLRNMFSEYYIENNFRTKIGIIKKIDFILDPYDTVRTEISYIVNDAYVWIPIVLEDYLKDKLL